VRAESKNRSRSGANRRQTRHAALSRACAPVLGLQTLEPRTLLSTLPLPTVSDHIDISGLGVTSSQYASAVHITDASDGALITVGDTQVTVLGMHASSFNAKDFIFA